MSVAERGKTERTMTKSELLAALRNVDGLPELRNKKPNHRTIYECGEGSRLRFAYEQFVGPIPGCDVRFCVNPAHLFVGTAYDNAIDCLVKGRNKATKLSEEQVKEIKQSTRSIKELAAAHGVGETTIGHIRQGIAWRHV
jgi:hypothetical protein